MTPNTFLLGLHGSYGFYITFSWLLCKKSSYIRTTEATGTTLGLIVHERHTTDLFQSGQRKDVVSLANQVVLFGSRDFPRSFYHLLQ